MHYSVATSEGIFRIIQVTESWGLFLNDVFLGNYKTAEKAAQSVALRKTGWDAWDLGKSTPPDDLEAWRTEG